MIASKWDDAENQSLRFSLAALFVVMTAVAGLFGRAGVKAVFLLPLLVAAGFLIALGRLIESRGWGGAGVYALRFAATAAAPWASSIAITVVLWLMVFSFCGYDEVLASAFIPREAFAWVLYALVAALTWFFSSRRWAYQGCWACPAVLLLIASPHWIVESIADSEAVPSALDLREAGLVYLTACGLFIVGLLGERRRRNRISLHDSKIPSI
jgi:hypothetical protein